MSSVYRDIGSVSNVYRDIGNVQTVYRDIGNACRDSLNIPYVNITMEQCTLHSSNKILQMAAP